MSQEEARPVQGASCLRTIKTRQSRRPRPGRKLCSGFAGIDVTKCPACGERTMRTTWRYAARALQRTAANMITANTEMSNPAPTSIPENSPVFRNDILLPKSPVSCIVVYERGLRSLSGIAAFHPNNPQQSHAPANDALASLTLKSKNHLKSHSRVARNGLVQPASF